MLNIKQYNDSIWNNYQSVKSNDYINNKTNMENQELTFGQKAVGLKFNHATGNLFNDVEKAKLLSAELIDLVEKHKKELDEKPSIELRGYSQKLTWETNVFRTQAFNKMIEAQMAVVKFLTWEN